MLYLTVLVSAIILSVTLSSIVRKIAISQEILDIANIKRKKHAGRTPLMGGTAVFLALFIVLFFIKDEILAGNLESHHWLSVFFGALTIIIGGVIDDKYNISPRKQLIFPITACIIVITGGIEMEKITNPFNSEQIQLSLVLSNILIFTWLMSMMYTTKLLDGLDGLVSGVVGIGAFIIFIFTLSAKYYQPDIGLASLAFAGTCFGFLILNWHPAKIFLGEGGSLFMGYMLGVLAIISGGKVAITLIIIGLPAIDMTWTIIRRLLNKKNPFTSSDRSHLHHLLNDSGLGPKKTALLYYLFSGIFGVTAIFLQSTGKLITLIFLIAIMILSLIALSTDKRKKISKAT